MAMQIKITLSVLSLCIFSIVSLAQAEPRSVDARDFDIAGVKTGMDWNEALAAAAKHFQASPSDFKPENYPNKDSYVALITGVNHPRYFSYKKDGVEFIVHFVARVPVDKARPLAVYQIKYEIPYSQANSAEMKKAALAKYGEQSNAPNDLPMEWCAKPSPNTGIGCGIDNDAVLELSQVGMELIDMSWHHEQQKFIDGMKTTKPNF